MAIRVPFFMFLQLLGLMLLGNLTFAQAPVISYSPSTISYTNGVAITPATPGNSGGAVPANTYGNVTTFVPSTSSLNNPRGIAHDAAGNLYEADFSSNQILKITPAGVVSVLAGSGTATEVDGNGTSATFNGPTGIVYDGSTYLYVADNGGNKIRRITIASPYTVLTIAGTGANSEKDNPGATAKFSKPYGIDYDGSTYLYITDNSGNVVRRMTTASPYTVTTIAGSGTAGETNNTTGTSARLNGPAGIVYDGSAFLYVADQAGNVIKKISTSGTFATTTFAGSGTAGSADGTTTAATFKTPYGVTFDQTGNLIVADEGNNLIRSITIPGGVVTTLAGSGTRADVDGVTTAAQFYSPYAVENDNSGNIYTGDNNGTNSTLREITLTGYTISATLPAGLSFDNTTGIISGLPTAATAAANYVITGYNASGSSSVTLNITVVNPPTPAISYVTPQVYMVGTTISTLSPTSSNVSPLGTYSAGTAFGTGNTGPQGITFDPSGNLYVTNMTGSTIRKYSSTGTFTSTFGSGLTNPYDMAFDASSNAYIISGNTIQKITSGGTQSTFIPVGLSTPRGIATDAAGNIYVANYGSSAIQKYNSSGLLTLTIAAPPGLYDVTVDASGNIYGLSTTGGTITEYNAAGVLQSTLSPTAAGVGLANAVSIYFDASNNLYIADASNNRVLEYQGSTLVANIPTGSGTSPRGAVVDAAGNVYVTLNTANAVNKYTPTGGYFINQALPAGLNFDNITGNITGTPTATSVATTYTVTAYNGVSVGTATVNITVNAALAVTRCGAGSVTLTASPASPAGGTYKWYANATTLTVLQSSTSAVYTTNVVATTTFYVTYTTGGVESARSAVNVTVNPIVSAPYTGAYFSYPFNGNSNDVSGAANNGVLTAAPSLTADRYLSANSAYSLNGTTQYISTTTAAAAPTTFTVSLWFNTTVGGGKLIGFGNSQTGASTTYDRSLYMTNAGLLYYGVFNGTSTYQTINTTTAYNDGNWHHVILVSSSAGSTIYVDGTSQATSTTVKPVYTIASGYWRIGYDALSSANYPTAPTNLHFTGSIDDIAVYNSVFTTAQIASSNDLNQIGLSTTSICPGSPVSFTSPTITGATYTWQDPGGNIQTGQNVTFSSAIAGNYYLTVSGGTGGCGSTAVVNGLTINPTVGSPISNATFSFPFAGNASDISGNADNGTVSGATLTADRYGAASNAYLFNGTSNYITTATSITNPTVFTMSLWFKTTTTSGGKLLGFGSSQTGSSATADRHLYMANNGQLFFGVYPNTYQTINTTTSYNDGNWHHVVVTFASDGSKIYVDDLLQASNAAMTLAYVYNGYWRIGYDNLSGWPSAPTSNFFSGTIDDVAVYSRELTSAEIGNTNILNQIGTTTTTVCSGSPITFIAPLITGATYTWKDPSGTTITGVGQNNPTFSTSVAGTYTLTVTGGAGGCTSSASITPALTPLPSSTFTATPSVDLNSNATVTLVATYVASSTYTWDFNGGTPSTGTGQGPFTVQWSTPGIKTVTLTVKNAGGCYSTGTQTVAVSNTTYGNYAFRRSVTLGSAAVGITSTLTNFPVLLSISTTDLKITGSCVDKVVNPNGPNYDFAFVDPSSASELYYQVESYDQVNGVLLVWVQLPSIGSAANKTLSFYYGSNAPTVTHNTAFFQKTWTSDYQAVFHFNEAAFTGTTSDGTSNGHVGSLAGFASTDLVAGKIGSAYNFGGNNNLTTTPVNATVSFTISAWINLNTLGLDQKVMTTENASGLSSGGFKLGVYTDNTAESEDGGDVNRGSTPTPPTFATGAWHYVQGVYNGTTLSTYVDGVQDRILASTKNVTLVNTLYIGVGEGGQYPFNGLIDEPRVSSLAKSSDWIKMEYTDQNNPVAFTTLGSTVTTNLTGAASISGALTYTWTGATSTDPTVATNWNNTTAGTSNQLPAFDGTASLVIPTGLSKYPSLTADAALYGLTIASGASLNLNGHTLSVGCNIYNSSGGQILYGSNTSSGITWNGSLASQTYTGSTTASTAQLGNMTINNSAGGTITLSGGPVDIYNTLTLTKGNLVISASPAVFTLKSTATRTAGVAAIPTTSTITGNVTAERYLTGGANYRDYRVMSSPVYTATVSSNNVYSLNYLSNSTVLTGWTGTGGGFDKAGNPTLYLFREDQVPSNVTFTSGNFWGISTINNTPSYNYYVNGATTVYNLPVGNGYLFFFRGNKAAASLTAETTLGYVPTTVTLSTTGTLNQGSITVHNWYTPSSGNLAYTGTGTSPTTTNFTIRGFNMVGNPYASSIDWNTFNTTTATSGIYGVNINPTIYEFDPVTRNYATYNSVTGIATGNASNVIESGEGFFVQASAASPVLTFNESAKTTAQVTGSNLLLGKPADQTAYNSYLRLKLITDTVNYDDMVVGFNSASTTKYNPHEDSEWLPGMGPRATISGISADNVKASVKWVPLPKSNLSQVMKLNVTASASGTYTFQRTDFKEIPAIYEVWLMDSYKKDSLDIRNNTTYAFNVDLADTNSFGGGRFQVVIRENPGLALHLLNFTASKATNGSQVVWKTENEENYTNFTVQRSTDGGTSFDVIGGVSSSDLGTYSMLDTKPVNGADAYRLQMEDLNGNITYSKIVTLMYGAASNSIVSNSVNIYPNPTTGALNVTIIEPTNSDLLVPQNTATTTSKPAAAASYGIKIVNNTGSVISTATTSQPTWQTDLTRLLPGTYVIQVIDNNTKSVVGKGTVVKL